MWKKFIYVILVLIGMFYSVVSVSAITITSQSACYNYNHTTGAYGGTGCSDHVKKTDGGKYAYCSQFKLKFADGKYEKIDKDKWDPTKRKAVTSGYIIDLVNNYDKYKGDEVKKYGVTSITLNAYISYYPGDKYSRGNTKSSNDGIWYEVNNRIKAFIDEARSMYDKLKLGDKTFKDMDLKIEATSKNQVMNTLDANNNVYISDNIAITGMEATYGASDDVVKYVVSASSNNGSVQICLYGNGTGCSDAGKSVTLSNVSGSYGFYVLAKGVTSNDIISLNVKATNSTTYYTSNRYIKTGTKIGDKQLIIIQTEDEISRSKDVSYQLTVPVKVAPPEDPETPTPEIKYTSHQIVGYKSDETGALLPGAALEIWKDDINIASNRLAVNYNGGASIFYTYGPVDVTKDDFFNHDYYLVEKGAPNGYVLNEIHKFYTKGSGKTTNTIICYNNGDGESKQAVEEKDQEFCNFDDYVTMCKSSDGKIVAPNELGGCNFENDDLDFGITNGTGNSINSQLEDGNNSNKDDDLGDSLEKPVITWETICYKKSTSTEADEKYCLNQGNYTKVQLNNGTLVVRHTNVKNKILISKKALTGDEEVAGANLKICTEDSYNSKKNNCDPTTNIDEVELSWVSTNQPMEFTGLKKGTYYIVEVVPPEGYIKATTATKFSIDEYGDVKIGSKTITNEQFVKGEDAIVINNKLNSFSISKQDVATTKELPGAKISICLTHEDEKGEIQLTIENNSDECIPAVLVDGTVANWISTDTPKQLQGLPAGTYYLVEKQAPDGYSTTESILFTMKDDGTLVDKEGKSLKDNKLVMYDKKIEEVKTGGLSFYVIIGIVIFGVGIGLGSYLYLRKRRVIK